MAAYTCCYLAVPLEGANSVSIIFITQVVFIQFERNIEPKPLSLTLFMIFCYNSYLNPILRGLSSLISSWWVLTFLSDSGQSIASGFHVTWTLFHNDCPQFCLALSYLQTLAFCHQYILIYIDPPPRAVSLIARMCHWGACPVWPMHTSWETFWLSMSPLTSDQRHSYWCGQTVALFLWTTG